MKEKEKGWERDFPVGLYFHRRGYSSVGRAPALQAGGHEFESHYLHQQFRGKGTARKEMYLEN